MRIRIIRLGSSTAFANFEEGANATVQSALDQAVVPCDGYNISVNGLDAGRSTALAEGDVVTLVPKVEGGAGTL